MVELVFADAESIDIWRTASALISLHGDDARFVAGGPKRTENIEPKTVTGG
jgi:hypothetical protein